MLIQRRINPLLGTSYSLFVNGILVGRGPTWFAKCRAANVVMEKGGRKCWATEERKRDRETKKLAEGIRFTFLIPWNLVNDCRWFTGARLISLKSRKLWRCRGVRSISRKVDTGFSLRPCSKRFVGWKKVLAVPSVCSVRSNDSPLSIRPLHGMIFSKSWRFFDVRKEGWMLLFFPPFSYDIASFDNSKSRRDVRIDICNIDTVVNRIWKLIRYMVRRIATRSAE